MIGLTGGGWTGDRHGAVSVWCGRPGEPPTPFVTALRRVETVDSLLVEVRDEDGRSGWGEGTQTWKVTGDSVPGMTAALNGPLGETVLGRNPDDVEALTRDVTRAVVGNTSAKAALDCALHDLAAQRLGVPLARLLGGTTLRSGSRPT